MAYTNLPLFKSSFYTYRISLQQNNYELTFLWQDKTKSWHLDLAREDGTYIVQGERIVPEYPMLESLKIENLTGYFWLQPYAPSTVYADVARELPEYYFFSYIY